MQNEIIKIVADAMNEISLNKVRRTKYYSVFWL